MNNQRKHSAQEIARAVSAGQFGRVLDLGTASPGKKELKRMNKQLKSSENWYVKNGIVHSSNGASVPGYTKWCGIVAVDLKHTVYRYRILGLYYKDTLHYFAIPIEMLKGEDSIRSLPGIEFSPVEIRLLISMADELRDAKSDHEKIITLKHPVAETLYLSLDLWQTNDGTLPNRLLQLLRANRVLVWMMIAAFDMQLRVIKGLKRAPVPIYNFITSSKDLQAQERIISVFAALNFTTEAGTSEPIQIQLKDEKDLCGWYTHVDRMSVLCTSGTRLLRPLIDTINTRDQISKSGGLMPAPLPALPIVISRKVIHSPAAFDVDIQQNEGDLSTEDKDLLRYAMAWVLFMSSPKKMLQQLDKRMSAKNGYRLDPHKVWREILAKNFFESLDIQEEALALIADEEEVLDQARKERDASIQRAMDLLKDPLRYQRQIIDRPASKAEALEALSGEMVAFRFTPKRGEDAGTNLLAFTKASLARLLKQATAGEEVLDAFLDVCEKNGVLDSRKRTIKLGTDTIQAITFLID